MWVAWANRHASQSAPCELGSSLIPVKALLNKGMCAGRGNVAHTAMELHNGDHFNSVGRLLTVVHVIEA